MAISVLQRDAFTKSVDFNNQVNGIVARTAIYRAQAWTNVDDNTRQLLANVARSPESSGFTPVIIADDNWNLSYDEWASNPPNADSEIASKVQTHWLLLTGIKEPVAPAPAAP